MAPQVGRWLRWRVSAEKSEIRALYQGGLAILPVLGLLLLLFQAPSPYQPQSSETSLGFYVLRSGQIYSGNAHSLQAGDRLQFTYQSGDSHQLVLLSIDNSGKIRRCYPTSGEIPVEVIPGELHILDGSIPLPDSPGTLTFLGFFAVDSVQEAENLSREHAAEIQKFADSRPDVAILTLER